MRRSVRHSTYLMFLVLDRSVEPVTPVTPVDPLHSLLLIQNKLVKKKILNHEETLFCAAIWQVWNQINFK